MKKKIPTVYVLRTCDADMTSYGGFKWPESGKVVAPDWNPKAECGGGLHGFLKGEGKILPSFPSKASNAKWLIVRVRASEIVDLGGKVKFPRGTVVYCGDREGAIAKISKRHPEAAVMCGTATAGYSGTATAGDAGTATAGSYGTATAGYSGTATAGYSGTATAGDAGTLVIRWWDGKRSRLAVAYVGENGIEPNVAYKFDATAKAFKKVLP